MAKRRQLAPESSVTRRPTLFSPLPELSFPPRRLSAAIVPSAVADEPPLLVPEALFPPMSDSLFSPMFPLTRFLFFPAVAAPEVSSHPMQKLVDRRL